MPGSSACINSGERQVCDSKGQWMPSQTCAYVCSNGACGGECKPAARKCSGLQRQLCSDAGAWQNDGTACPFACSNGSCTGSCTPGDKQCASSTALQTCGQNSEWSPATTCPFACVANACGGECVPGSGQCLTSLSYRQCSSAGKWQAAQACATACVLDGQCGECTPGSRECSGGAPRVCDASGKWQQEAACSGVTSECSGGQCRAASHWKKLAAGAQHTCALRDDGTIWCWGTDTWGQLGNGAFPTSQTTPVQVVAAGQGPGGATWNDWTQVSAGRQFTCGIRADGTLWCWGDRLYGKLGDGGSLTGSSSAPRQVVATGEAAGGAAWNDWVQVSAGGQYGCGLRQNGTLWCWGSGTNGQRGDGVSDTNRATPVQVLVAGASPGGAAWSDWTQVAAGESHACGIRQNGTLWCWGGDSAGRRGDGTTDNIRATPIQVLAAGVAPGGATWSDWVQVAAGEYHTCGRRAGGTVWCWGDGYYGNRGDGTMTSIRATPIQVLQAGAAAGGAIWSDWTSIAVGATAQHACGVRSNGSLWCWGFGVQGQRGDGTEDMVRTTPIQVLQEGASVGGATWSDWTTEVAIATNTCGLRPGGALWCWGRGNSGERGDGSTTPNRSTPIHVISP